MKIARALLLQRRSSFVIVAVLLRHSSADQRLQALPGIHIINPGTRAMAIAITRERPNFQDKTSNENE
ncbi:hypothetical protein [Pantoea vagans]|uniref:hypothetical protein n=1 Tax=Pantoea vagans TaxID=470934 RepID=UPI00109386B7|nr:hypothetical protein [Pantoea vagans]QCA04419.1 hypothetical protein EGO56_09685 [Pantoea vagans]